MSDVPTSMIAESEPLFLELGKALWICQAFEGTLCFLLALIAQDDAQGEPAAFSAAIDLYSQKTLGQLLKRLQTRIAIPAETEKRLMDGWDRRNSIVHRFVHENIGDIMSPKGRLIVEQKLTHHKLTVKLADMSANEILDEYLAKYGLSNEDLKENADRMWNYLNRSSSSDEYLEH